MFGETVGRSEVGVFGGKIFRGNFAAAARFSPALIDDARHENLVDDVNGVHLGLPLLDLPRSHLLEELLVLGKVPLASEAISRHLPQGAVLDAEELEGQTEYEVDGGEGQNRPLNVGSRKHFDLF